MGIPSTLNRTAGGRRGGGVLLPKAFSSLDGSKCTTTCWPLDDHHHDHKPGCRQTDRHRHVSARMAELSIQVWRKPFGRRRQRP